jgi:ABC-type branched-subunit amino acid transport system ATPase component
MNSFGQLIIGPPGSGKTTYCHTVSKFLENMGRKVAVINVGEKINHWYNLAMYLECDSYFYLPHQIASFASLVSFEAYSVCTLVNDSRCVSSP